jgi:hypothetical protein
MNIYNSIMCSLWNSCNLKYTFSQLHREAVVIGSHDILHRLSLLVKYSNISSEIVLYNSY